MAYEGDESLNRMFVMPCTIPLTLWNMMKQDEHYIHKY